MTISGCGYNELYTLGIETHMAAVPKPTVILPTWDEVVQVSASASHTAGFFADGHAEMVGGNRYDAACDGLTKDVRPERILDPVRIGVPTARAFSLCESAGMVIDPEGDGLTWGGNLYGQDGIGTWSEGKERLEPPGVYTTPQRPAFDRKLRACGGGQYHKQVIAADGTPLAWGRNDVGECADGTRTVKLVPTECVGFDEAVIAIDGGAKHSLFLRADGRVAGSGQGLHGQLGKVGDPNRTTASLIDGLEGILAVAAGGGRSAFLREDGIVLVCGHEEDLHEWALPGPATWISVGTKHLAAIVEGEAYTEGDNEWGQLGDGTREDKAAPVATGVACRMVECGVGHTIFID